MSARSRSKRLTGVFFAFKRAMHERLKSAGTHGPTLPGLAVLSLVHERGEATMKDVSTFLCVAPPTATVVIESLAKQGLLIRRQDPKDRRSVRLQLTPKGNRSLGAGTRRIEAGMELMFKRLDAAEQEKLIKLLEKILI